MKQTLLILAVMAVILSSCQNNNNKQQNTEQKEENKTTIEHKPMDLKNFEIIKLVKPELTGGKTLIEAMHLRQSNREFNEKNLSLEHLSHILWVANGINRDNGKRTVPSAMAKYPIKTYAVMENGIYFYEPERHQLEPIVEGDYRELSGLQDFVYKAPLNLVFIADYNVYKGGDRPVPEDRYLYLAALDASHSCQNVYLYCASEGLKTVERAGAKAEELLKVLNLEDGNYQFIVAQTVGY